MLFKFELPLYASLSWAHTYILMLLYYLCYLAQHLHPGDFSCSLLVPSSDCLKSSQLLTLGVAVSSYPQKEVEEFDMERLQVLQRLLTSELI
jgi:hypothetical protein